MQVFITAASLDEKYGGTSSFVNELSVGLKSNGIPHQTIETTNSNFAGMLKQSKQVNAEIVNELSTSAPAIVHDNGIWLKENIKTYMTAAKQNCRILTSTHGMTMPLAMSNKYYKKKLAWYLYQRRILQNVDMIHVTSEKELVSLRHLGIKTPAALLPNFTNVPTKLCKKERKSNVKKVRFLGRLDPIKGLEDFIIAWSIARPFNWQFIISGPDFSGYRKHLENLVHTMNCADSIFFEGPVSKNEKISYFKDTDFLVLPSKSENFGMVVAEALANGVPALVSTGAPWQILDEEKCGFWVENNVQQWILHLQLLETLDDVKLAELSANAHKTAVDIFCANRIIHKFIELYEHIAYDTDKRPNFIYL
jgi:glycosyltransferase involved in cell wall biosynthesis